MVSEQTILIGCSPQARYALETFNRMNISVYQIFDPVGEKVGQKIHQFTVKPFTELDNELENGNRINALICLSDNKLKQTFYNRLNHKVNFINAVHPGSYIDSSVQLGTGIIINATAVVQSDATIGNGCMIHAGVIIEHDNIIGNFANLSPGVTLAGGVCIGDWTTVYSGVTVVPNIKIGKNVIIGAGSLVKNDVPDNSFAFGIPAKIDS